MLNIYLSLKIRNGHPQYDNNSNCVTFLTQDNKCGLNERSMHLLFLHLGKEPQVKVHNGIELRWVFSQTMFEMLFTNTE